MDAIIRQMSQSEQQQLIQWAALEGWNPGIHDAELFWNLDPAGFMAIEVADKLVGGGAVIRHNSMFGFMGLFIVEKQFRGQKLGSQLWEARKETLQSRLESGATIGLDGVDEMVPFYERGGFRQFTRHRRFEFTSTDTAPDLDPGLTQLSNIDFQDIEDMDAVCFPGSRRDFLKSWIEQDDAIGLGLVEKDRLRGYGLMRPCLSGWKVGPLIADEIETANRLWTGFSKHGQGKSIFIDSPDNNPSAIHLCKSFSMTEVFGCQRMYCGQPPELDHSRIFGITTLEVG
ncbi:MAG: GNAT family N-acetyltransferase [Mariniblastus sp.]